MKRIPQDFIIDLIARINIVDIVGQRIKIKKRGKDYWGNCPFHNEKTPSFSVSEKKQMYYCFGCGAGGSSIDFLMNYDRLSYPEAIEELANLHGITVPHVETSTNTQHQPQLSGQNIRRDLYGMMGKLADFYHTQLTSRDAQQAQEYLTGRGLDDTTINHYKIGYSPDEWRSTFNHIAKTAQEKKLYDQAGMLVSNDNGNQYDRFRGRIMFPIRDRQGNIIAFGGRTIKANDSAKYINSPETAIFHKGYQLYGLYEAQQINRNPEKLLVVEGYMDVVALAQFGINYAVAALGTATTEDHIKLLFRATDNIIFCFDGDAAGRRAAWRALNVLLPTLIDGKQIKFVFLPDNEDPDSLVRKEGKALFETRLDNGITLSQFLFDELLSQVDLKTSEGRAKLSSLVLPLIAQIKAHSFSLNLKQQLGDYLGFLDISQIDKLLQQYDNQDSAQPKLDNKMPVIKMKLTTMRILIGLLIQYPELAKLVPDINTLKPVKLAGVDVFIELLEICQTRPNIITAQILTEFANKPIVKQLNTLAIWEHKYAEEEISTIFSHTLKELYDNILIQRQDELIAKDRMTKLTEAEKQELATLILVLSKKD
ncbi:DNA primase [Orbus hercynius]|uniref:DNA primase n=1 Tax=Orbus hercynius TaxID=593135 RepID=A0A495RB29_9GAMM|nr:DNA primase [Orbus hercynius]RKS84609.1 DNA primase [Orbus hercynius]